MYGIDCEFGPSNANAEFCFPALAPSGSAEVPQNTLAGSSRSYAPAFAYLREWSSTVHPLPAPEKYVIPETMETSVNFRAVSKKSELWRCVTISVTLLFFKL